MPFAYYSRLTRAQQRVYRRSDEIGAIPLREAAAIRPAVETVEEALAGGERGRTEVAAQTLFDCLTVALGVPPVRAEVLAARPSRTWGELHGLYVPGERGGRARITLWMRTAQRRQVVAPRTFLRTLVHELCHHLDYDLLKLPDSFHTEGFYRRESSIVHQLVGSGVAPEARAGRARTQGAGRAATAPEGEQECEE
jgi:hypothetical protein